MTAGKWNAGETTGIATDSSGFRQAAAKGFKTVMARSRVAELPNCDCFVMDWDTYLEDGDNLIHRLLSNKGFTGTVAIFAEDSQVKIDEFQKLAWTDDVVRIRGRLGRRLGGREAFLALIKAEQFQRRDKDQRCAVVSLAIGEPVRALRDLVVPVHQAYAQRIGAEHVLIDSRKFKGLHIHFEKFQIYKLLETFDRVIYIDLDAVIRPDCPDLFSLVPEDRLGVRFERTLYERTGCEWVNAIASNRPKVRFRGDYFNSGVIVASKAHRALFEVDDKPYIDASFAEQSLMNYRAAQHQYKFYELGRAFNHWDHGGRDLEDMAPSVYSGYITHFAGIGGQRCEDLLRGVLDKWESGDLPDLSDYSGSRIDFYSNQKFVLNGTYKLEKVGDRYKIRENNRIFYLNPQGAMLLEYCDGETCFDEILDSVREMIGDQQDLRRLVEAGIRGLIDSGLIRPAFQYRSDKDLPYSWLPSKADQH